MVATVAVLLVAHVAEVVLWSVTYGLVDAAPPEADLLYFALVNYTTLGYGDVLPVARWRLLGPITAMNGILLFGWSTAVIFRAEGASSMSRASSTSRSPSRPFVRCGLDQVLSNFPDRHRRGEGGRSVIISALHGRVLGRERERRERAAEFVYA